MRISSFVCFDAIIPELKSADRDGAISELVLALGKANRFENKSCQNIIKSVIERENEASTGIGKGVAVPHTKHPAIKRIVAAVGRKSVGIDFISLDKQPVYSVILVLSPPDDAEEHLRVMETIIKHLQRENFRKF